MVEKEPILKYSMEFLKSLKQSASPPGPWLRKILYNEGVARTPTRKTCISVHDHLECLWVKVRPSRLPRHVSAIAVCVVYSPPQPSNQDELIEHLIASSDLLCIKHPDIGLIILGDFNHLRVQDICLDSKLCQIVQNNTGGEAILDMITNNIKSVYKKPEPPP